MGQNAREVHAQARRLAEEWSGGWVGDTSLASDPPLEAGGISFDYIGNGPCRKEGDGVYKIFREDVDACALACADEVECVGIKFKGGKDEDDNNCEIFYAAFTIVAV